MFRNSPLWESYLYGMYFKMEVKTINYHLNKKIVKRMI